MLLAVALSGVVTAHLGFLPYRVWLVVPATLGMLAAAVRVRLPQRLGRRWSRSAASPGWGGPGLLHAVALGGAIACTIVAQLTRYPYGWDAAALMRMARTIDGGQALQVDSYDYLSLFPNTIPMIAVDRLSQVVGPALGVSADSAAVTLNGACLAATLAIAGLLVHHLAGLGPALWAQGTLIVLVGLSPWLTVPYTDVLAMPLVMGSVALAVLAMGRRAPEERVLLGALATGAAAGGYVVKTTPVVLVAAALLLILLAALRPGGTGVRARLRVLRAVAAAASVLAVFLGASDVLGAAATSASGVDPTRVRVDASPPISWWVANGLGLKAGPNGGLSYGTYDSGMVQAIERRSPEQMRAYARGYIADRLAERGPVGTAAFYAHKAVWIWADGMFWAWGEGGDASRAKPINDGPAAAALAAANQPRGALYPTRADLTQGLWLAILVITGVGAWIVRPRRDLLFLMLIVLGVGGFTLLFQGRSRYVLTFVPVVVTLAACLLPRVRALSRPAVPRRRAGAAQV